MFGLNGFMYLSACEGYSVVSRLGLSSFCFKKHLVLRDLKTFRMEALLRLSIYRIYIIVIHDIWISLLYSTPTHLT